MKPKCLFNIIASITIALGPSLSGNGRPAASVNTARPSIETQVADVAVPGRAPVKQSGLLAVEGGQIGMRLLDNPSGGGPEPAHSTGFDSEQLI